MRRLSLAGLLVMAVLISSIEGNGGPGASPTPTPTPGPSTANLWIDTTGGTCTRQGTAASYGDAAACSSVQNAVAACTAGDTIRMKAGSYGSQTITTDRTTPGCTVIAEDGTSLGALTTHGNWFEIQNVDATDWNMTEAATTNVTGRDVRVEGGDVSWAANGFSNFNWIGGSLKNFSCSSCAQGFAIFASTSVGGTSVASDILIDGVEFDNIDNTGGTGNHFEVIRIDGKVEGFTMRNSSITNSNASSSLIFHTTFRGTKPDDLTYENNFFGSNGDAYFTINDNYQGAGCANRVYRYNTFQDSAVAGGNCSYTNIVWVGNLAPAGDGCQGSSFTDNVWYGSGSTCHASDLVIGTSGLGGDDGFHLQSGSGAIDAGGTGGDCIATDHDGDARPIGARCDAGADEGF